MTTAPGRLKRCLSQAWVTKNKGQEIWKNLLALLQFQSLIYRECCTACLLSSQAHAVETICSNDRLAFQFNNLWARRGSATNSGGSPARRGAMRFGTLCPVTCSIVETTSLTEAPVPVPRLSFTDSPPRERCSMPSTCASAKSVTWM